MKSSTGGRRIRLLYVPGTISLAFLLPLLLMAMSARQKVKLYVMEVTWAPDDWPASNDIPNSFKRNLIELTLSGDAMRDKTKVDFAALTIDEMTSTLDTLQGLKIIFNDSAKYESLVRILTICDRYPHLTYVPSTDHILILNRYKSEKQKQVGFMCGTMYHMRCIPDPPVSPVTKKYLPVFSLLILLGVVSIFKATRS